MVLKKIPRLQHLKVYSVSLGCPKNRVDTEHLLGSLGYGIHSVSKIGLAQLVFVNTCGFIESAVKESVRTILHIAEAVKGFKRRPLFVVAGCLVGRYGREELAREIPEVDLWLSSEELTAWPEQLLAHLGSKAAPRNGRLLSTGPSYAWLKIGEGCKHNCAFCTIPSIRGPLKATSGTELLEEARILLNEGVSELDVVAQDVTSWDDGRWTLQTLLEKLSSLPHLLWLRLLYLYPTGLTPELLHFIRDNGNPLLPYFDVPLQHAHNDILKRMGRPFQKNPRTVVDTIKNILPEAAIRTTFIVGFPGETDSHFESLCRLVEEGYFHHVGVFAYEREEGTRAYSFENQVPREIAEERKRILLDLQREQSEKILEGYVGETMAVLVDSHNPEWPGLCNGRVWFQAPEVDGQTYISGPNVSPGAMTQAEIVESTTYDLTALAD
ncbi:MAG: 30S ribosomal protein S12 methylthiotransferase RimO [Desulfovibrio sp.]|nr:30S ribosomal protein S12 methylthiotransferase RimO [Desulfovibrio sp.]